MSFALALLLAIGTTTICAAKTFVYVSNAQDGNIDAYTMDTSTGSLTPIGKVEAGKLVMPMAVSPDKKHLYAVVRSQPPRVLTYAIDPTTGALTQKASAPLPESMPYVSTDRTGRYLFTASYGGNKLAVSPIGESGLVEAGAIHVIPLAAMRIRSWPIAATNSCTRPRSAPTRCCNSPSTARPASSRPTIRRRSAPGRVTVHAIWCSLPTTRTSM
jgi:hypothetical protein